MLSAAKLDTDADVWNSVEKTSLYCKESYSALSTKHSVLSRYRFFFELLGLVVSDERLNDFVEVAFHHQVELMDC